MNGAGIMSRTKKVMIVTIVVIFIALVLTPIVAIQANKYIYKNRVSTYLIEEKGFVNEDIELIEGKWGKLPTFYVNVVFKNEPHVKYTYFAHDNDVYQFSYEISDEGRNVGIVEGNLKNYHPR